MTPRRHIRHALLPLAIVVASCATAPTTVSVERSDGIPVTPVSYEEPWAALQCADFAYLQTVELDDEERTLVRGIEALAQGRLDRAQRDLLALRDAPDERTRKAARGALGRVLEARGDWSRYAAVAEDQANVDLARGWRDDPAEQVVFAAPEADVPLDLPFAGLPQVEVVVNGRSFRFGVDTGTDYTTLAARAAEACGAAVRAPWNPEPSNGRSAVGV